MQGKAMALAMVAIAVSVLVGGAYGRELELDGVLSVPTDLDLLLQSGAQDEYCGPELSIETAQCTVLKKTPSYEIRQYPAGQIWVSTLVNASFEESKYTGFYRLFYFISGKNSRAEKIEMTAPVLIWPEPNRHGYVISFFVPHRFKTVEDLPEPLDSTVFFHVEEEVNRAVVGPFGGFPTLSDYQEKWKQLKGVLDRDEVKYNELSVTYLGYSSPFQFVGRKQEVFVNLST